MPTNQIYCHEGEHMVLVGGVRKNANCMRKMYEKDDGVWCMVCSRQFTVCLAGPKHFYLHSNHHELKCLCHTAHDNVETYFFGCIISVFYNILSFDDSKFVCFLNVRTHQSIPCKKSACCQIK